MRILVIGINFHPELTGIGKYTGEMAEYLAVQWKIEKPYSGWRYQQEQWSGVDVVRCPLWVPKKPSGVKRLLHLFSFTLSGFPVVLMQRKWKAEIIINIAPSLLSALPALLLAQLTDAKTWLHIQDFEVDAALNLGLLPSKFSSPALAIERKLLERFDRVSTISTPMLTRLFEKGIKKHKTYLFPNWIDTEKIFPKETSTLRTEWGIDDDTIIILYSGNMGTKQGLEILIDAGELLSEHSNILFVLCGDGAAKLGLEEKARHLVNIRFYPLQPLERLNELLNIADIHMLPQRADAVDLVMPSKLSGMLASGRVVIATAPLSSALGRIIDEVGILVPPEDARELAKKIHEASADPQMRTILGEKGRKWVMAHWAKEKVLSSFEKKLEGMLK